MSGGAVALCVSARLPPTDPHPRRHRPPDSTQSQRGGGCLVQQSQLRGGRQTGGLRAGVVRGRQGAGHRRGRILRIQAGPRSGRPRGYCLTPGSPQAALGYPRWSRLPAGKVKLESIGLRDGGFLRGGWAADCNRSRWVPGAEYAR